MMSIGERWSDLWHRLDRTAPVEMLDAIQQRHAEPHRHYHTIDHVLDCLTLAAEQRAALDDPEAVELAFFFHDAIYDPWRSDNEARSAAWAADCLGDLDLSPERLARIDRLILITRHPSTPSTSDETMMIDIDLSILGAEPVRYDAYETAIRQEYRRVPGFLYRRGRRKLLRHFLAQERLFHTSTFTERYDTAARANLRRALSVL